MAAVRWLDRRIARQGPYLALALDEPELRRFEKAAGVPAESASPFPQAGACTITIGGLRPDPICVVCLAEDQDATGVEIAGILVHEAVHVWQTYCDDIGETQPASEQMAYGIQAIAQELMQEYVRRMM